MLAAAAAIEAMAAYTICTRATVDSLTRSTGATVSSSWSSGSVESVKAVAVAVCAMQKPIRGLGRTQSRPIGLFRRRRAAWEQTCAAVVRAERGDRGRDSNRDEDGVIKDMEVYLDDLSLEYESVWDTKPAWCQPWTIVTTGLAVIGGSWFSFQNTFITGGASFVIGVWWFSFLYAYPLAYTEMIAERRKNVKNGSEDTFGTSRIQ